MTIARLQWRQELHDRLFHFDIYSLPKAQRFNHLLLHLGKYNGRLAVSGGAGSPDTKTAVDAMIIPLSLANLTGIRLQLERPEWFKPSEFTYTDALKRACILTGQLCTLMEGLDHLEPVCITAGCSEVLARLIAVWWMVYVAEEKRSYNRPLAMEEVILQRLVQVEEKHIHYDQLVLLNPGLKP